MGAKTARPGAPTSAAATLEEAAGLHQVGRLDEARGAYRALLRGPPAQRRNALKLLGLLERQGGDLAQALAIYDQLLAMGERSGEVFHIRGDLLHGLGRADEALRSYDRAVQLEPSNAVAWNNRGALLEAAGRGEAAIASYDAALKARPDYPDAWYNRGVALSGLRRTEAALESYDRALALRPQYAQALNNRGLLLSEAGRQADALTAFDQALAAAPDYAEAHSNRAATLRRLGRLEAALASADAALGLRPAYPEALNARGLALAALMRFDEALASYEGALALRPAYPEALSNSGLALAGLGRFDEALQRYEAALALDPGFADAEFNSGLALLRLGRPEGWRRHEARFRRPGQPGPTFPNDTVWLGGEDIAGKTLLLHAEQGLGDTIQFCRFAPAVAARGARVVLQVQPALKRLMSELAGVDQVLAIGERLPAFDRHVPLMSLPLALGEAASTAFDAPYLRADPDRRAAWDQRLGARRPRIGLCWAGNPAHENDRNRSIPLAMLAPLIDPGVQVVSLQKAVPARDEATLAAMPDLLRVGEELADFSDTAALIAALDLVISVDTSVAHLAGALGTPVWILLPRLSDWRWGAHGLTDDVDHETTPWYACARLYRQRRFGDWGEVVARVACALAGVAEAKRSGAAPQPPWVS